MLSAIHTQSNTPQPSPEEVVRMTAGAAHRVDSNVYIGGYLIAADPAFIRRAGISRIVKLFADDPSYPGGYHRHPGVRYLVVPASDVPEYDIRAGAEAALRFIQEGIAANERILVHCHAGVSRSATVVLLHLMVNRGYDLDAALGRLRLVRPFVNPNPGFMDHLRATDARIKRLRVGREHVDETPIGGPRRFFIAPPPISAADASRWMVQPPPPATAHDAALLLRLARSDRGHAGGRSEDAEAALAAEEDSLAAASLEAFRRTPARPARPWAFAEDGDSIPL